jgi:hypothetical protein
MKNWRQKYIVGQLCTVIEKKQTLTMVDLGFVVSNKKNRTAEDISFGELIYQNVFKVLLEVAKRKNGFKITFVDEKSTGIVWPDYSKILTQKLNSNRLSTRDSEYKPWFKPGLFKPLFDAKSIKNELRQPLSPISHKAQRILPYLTVVKNLYKNWTLRYNIDAIENPVKTKLNAFDNDREWLFEKGVWKWKEKLRQGKSKFASIKVKKWEKYEGRRKSGLDNFDILTQMVYGKEAKISLNVKDPLAVALSTEIGIDNFILSEIMEELASECLMGELYAEVISNNQDAVKEIIKRRDQPTTSIFNSCNALFKKANSKRNVWTYMEYPGTKPSISDETDIKRSTSGMRIQYNDTFEGVTLDIDHEKREVVNVDKVLATVTKLRDNFKDDLKITDAPFYESYSKSVKEAKEIVENISNKSNPWHGLVSEHPREIYPIAEIKKAKEEMDKSHSLLTEVKKVRNHAIKFATEKRNEYTSKINDFNNECKRFQTDLETCKVALQPKNKKIDRKPTTVLVRMDEKLKKLSSSHSMLKKFAIGLGLKSTLDTSFSKLKLLVDQVKKCKDTRLELNLNELNEIRDYIDSLRQTNPGEIDESKLNKFDKRLVVEAKNYEILNGKDYSKKVQCENAVKDTQRRIKAHKAAQNDMSDD